MTILMTNDAGLSHQMPPGHPEQIARLDHVNRALSAPEFDGLDRRPSPMAEESDLLLAHPASHVSAIRDAAPDTGFAALDPDTSMSPGTWEAALRGVGGCLAAVDAVLAGEAKNAIVATRPPGHHAEKARPMGFCLFGNVAIAAKHALERHGLSRVAIVDFDVHHGNGTQDVFWDDPSVLFISLHQWPLYPGTGWLDERGAGDAVGSNVNIPLPPGSGDRQWVEAIERVALPKIESFDPGLIVVSAGQDGHFRDGLSDQGLTAAGFGRIAASTASLADSLGAGLVAVQEGGYNPATLPLLDRTILRAFDDPTGPPLPESLEDGPAGVPEPDGPEWEERLSAVTRSADLD